LLVIHYDLNIRVLLDMFLDRLRDGQVPSLVDVGIGSLLYRDSQSLTGGGLDFLLD
jgi:hypothetical protein